MIKYHVIKNITLIFVSNVFESLNSSIFLLAAVFNNP